MARRTGCASTACLATRRTSIRSIRASGSTSNTKHVELANVCCPTPTQLRHELRRAADRLRHKRHIVLGCIRHAGYHL